MRGRRTLGQKLFIGANVLLVITCLAGAIGLMAIRDAAQDIERVPIAQGGTGLRDRALDPGEPRNFLMVGVDDSEGLAPDDPVLRGRDSSLNTDTIMIVRVDPITHSAAILSLPRDLWVAIPPSRYANGRINEALASGGPQKLVETIETNFAIPIDHYAQVSFAGFKQIVDVLGGVPLLFPWEAKDDKSGLVPTGPGCIVLEGDQALGFVRSRSAFAIKNDNGRWEFDQSGDFGRIRRQQEFVRAAMRRAIDRGARNPVTLAELINAAQGAVVLDEHVTIAQLIALGEEMRDFDPEDLQVYQPPVTGFTTAGGAEVLRLQEREAQPIFDIFRGVNVFTGVEATVRVEVQNGTGRSGQARVVGEELASLGFAWTQSFDAADFDNPRTTIRYAAPEDRLAAVLLARYLDLDVALEPGEMQSPDSRVALVLGSDFSGFRSDPRPLEEVADLLPPEMAVELEAATEGVPSTTTTIPPTTSSFDALVPGQGGGTDCR